MERTRTVEGGGAATAKPRPQAIRLLVADDHEMVRWGLRGVLQAGGFEVVAEASDGSEAVAKTLSLAPDVVILDITMPRLNGLAAARRIRALAPRTEVLILSMHHSDQVVREALEAGARGYILKIDAAKHLISAVEALAAHRPFFTSEVSRHLLDSYLSRSENAPRGSRTTRDLTGREQEIIQLLAEGKSNKEVAALLGLSVKTVETHRSNIMRKLGLRGLSDLIHYALRNNLTAADTTDRTALRKTT
jgi:DNA-binding NarL/FixJ family response regulator